MVTNIKNNKKEKRIKDKKNT